MLTWCSRAVNFSFPSFRAVSRTRSNPLGLLSRLGVRSRLGCCVFSLARDLPSTTSAGVPSLLFGCFVGNMSQYDSPSSFMKDLPLIAFSSRPTLLLCGRRRGLPVLAHGVSLHAWGLRLRRTTAHSRYRAQPCCLLVRRRHGLPEPLISELDTQPTDTPVQRFESSLAAALAWLGARVVRYTFPVRLFHSRVGSRAGAAFRRFSLSVAPRFLWECLTNRTVNPFPVPASSNPAGGFPALGFPACFSSRLCGCFSLERLSLAPLGTPDIH